MKTLLAVLLVFFFLSGRTQIQNEETICTFKKSGNYLIELAGFTNFIDIYLYDLDERPVRGLKLRGKVDFFYPDEFFASTELVQYARTNSLRATIPGNGFYNFKETLFFRSDIISAYFDNTCDLRAQANK